MAVECRKAIRKKKHTTFTWKPFREKSRIEEKKFTSVEKRMI